MTKIPAAFQDALQNLEWYHPAGTRHIAEGLLLQNGSDGSYLLRPSKSEPLAISVRCKDSVKHFPVSFEGDQICFGLAAFDDAEEFKEHFRRQPFIAGESGVITWLKLPYPRSVEEPELYDKVKIHAQYQEKITNLKPQQLSLATKEGYMTKLGGFVRNWKLRWFTLKKYELRYFKQSSDPDPIRALDLCEVTECASDSTHNRPHCFRLVFPWRTFYLSCDTEAEKEEWIQLILWKLTQNKRILA